MNIEIAILLVLAGSLYLCRRQVRSVTIFDFQKGLLYRKGHYIKTLGTGKYYYLKSMSVIQIVDTRKTLVKLPGQDILTKDNVNVKVSLVGFYEVIDPVKAKHLSVNYTNDFYNFSQIILRDIVGRVTIDELLDKKGELDAQLLAGVAEKVAALGLSVSLLAMKDIMLPGNLKKAFSGVLEAQKEAQRQLEKARGEQAVLRNLANSSKMYESNPMLLQARLVQALSGGNNSIVFNADETPALKVKSQK